MEAKIKETVGTIPDTKRGYSTGLISVLLF
jgi:hypothetical protein